MAKVNSQNRKECENEYNIFKSFKKYIEQTIILFKDDSIKKIKYLNLYSDNKRKIEELENGKEFSFLIDETMKIDSPFIKTQFFWNNKETWESAIKNFFRRSYFYNDIIKKKHIDTTSLFAQYLKLFKNDKTIITYYALIDSVYFPKNIMNFGSYKICRFSEEELNTIFCKKITEMFYPYAIIDSNKLKNYWFICVAENQYFKESSLKIDNKVKFEHSEFAKNVEVVLKKFSLFDWQWCDYENDSDEKDKWWIHPGIPYVFSENENLLTAPSPIYFDYRQLTTEPFIDPHTNEEIGEIPHIIFHLGDDFEDFMLQIEHIFSELKNNNNLNFIDNALGHFIKAFFAQGIEELLWHFFSIEALLGTNAPGLINRIARRAALIIEKERAERKYIYGRLKKLYDIRSKLVHGDASISKGNKVPNIGDLYTMRDISRRILLWFLNFISHNIKNFENQKSELIQQEIFTTIDLEPEKIFNNINT